MKEISFNPNDPVFDIIFRIKVRDAMTEKPFTISSDATMEDAKNIMKEKNITGLPVVKDRHLKGILTIQDIIKCFETGNLSDPVKNYMTRDLIVFKEDMPVSFAISHFEKYKFRRFPVLNKGNELSGIISSRDISIILLNEITEELRKIDSSKNTEETDIAKGKYFRQFSIRKYDFENAGKVSISIKKLLKEIGIEPSTIRRVAIAVYELEINQIVHSDGGTMQLSIHGNEIAIKATDTGPGIPDLDKVLTEGYSTASEWVRSQGFGAGMGLPNVKKVSDDFQISSDEKKGTEILIKIFTKEKGDEEK